MRILEFGPPAAKPVTAFGSRGLSAAGLVRGDAAALTVLHVAPGGEIGRHPAVTSQLFLVVSGRGSVSGGDGTWHPIAPGQAVLWQAGEEHATRADEPMTAVVLEMPELPMASRHLIAGPSPDRTV